MFGLRLKKKSRVQLENNNNIFLYMHVCSVEFQQQVILQIFVIQKCLLSAQHLSSNERDGVSSSSATCSIFRSFTNPTTRQDAHQLSCKSEHYLRARKTTSRRRKPPATNWAFPDLHLVWMPDFLFFYPHVKQKKNKKKLEDIIIKWEMSWTCVRLCCHDTGISNFDTISWKINIQYRRNKMYTTLRA